MLLTSQMQGWTHARSSIGIVSEKAIWAMQNRKGRQGTKMTSLETIKYRTIRLRSTVVDWQKKPQSLEWHGGDPAESGDSGESVPGNKEGNTLGHLINPRPQIRLIMHQARIESSSRMTGGVQLHRDPTPPGSRFFSCDALAPRSVHAAR